MAKSKIRRTKPHCNIGTIGQSTWQDDIDGCDHQDLRETGQAK